MAIDYWSQKSDIFALIELCAPSEWNTRTFVTSYSAEILPQKATEAQTNKSLKSHHFFSLKFRSMKFPFWVKHEEISLQLNIFCSILCILLENYSFSNDETANNLKDSSSFCLTNSVKIFHKKMKLSEPSGIWSETWVLAAALIYMYFCAMLTTIVSV